MSRQALEMALEALEDINSLLTTMTGATFTKLEHATKVAKEALAQPEHEFVRGECVKCGASIERQEPVAWVSEIAEEAELMLEKPRFRAVALYTTPPQRTWVGLTDEEIFTELERVDPETKRLPAGLKIFAHYLEARLKEKNT